MPQKSSPEKQAQKGDVLAKEAEGMVRYFIDRNGRIPNENEALSQLHLGAFIERQKREGSSYGAFIRSLHTGRLLRGRSLEEVERMLGEIKTTIEKFQKEQFRLPTSSEMTKLHSDTMQKVAKGALWSMGIFEYNDIIGYFGIRPQSREDFRLARLATHAVESVKQLRERVPNAFVDERKVRELGNGSFLYELRHKSYSHLNINGFDDFLKLIGIEQPVAKPVALKRKHYRIGDKPNPSAIYQPHGAAAAYLNFCKERGRIPTMEEMKEQLNMGSIIQRADSGQLASKGIMNFQGFLSMLRARTELALEEFWTTEAGMAEAQRRVRAHASAQKKVVTTQQMVDELHLLPFIRKNPVERLGFTTWSAFARKLSEDELQLKPQDDGA